MNKEVILGPNLPQSLISKTSQIPMTSFMYQLEALNTPGLMVEGIDFMFKED
jgi:hypothetical protein